MSSRAEIARLPILDALLAAGPDGASREDLILASDTSKTSFYRIVKPLIRDGLVEELGYRYRLILAKLYNYRYKLWRDSEKLLQVDADLRTQIEDVVQEAQEELSSNLLALWLVGSVAHGTMSPDSDLDFLAVTKRESGFFPRRIRRDVQFVTMTSAAFQAKMKAKDSFVLSALRYGLLLEDRGFSQTWLDTPHQIELEARHIRHTEEALEALRNRMFFFVKENERSESLKSLKAYAVTLGRALLAFYRELPAGRPDLIEGLHLFYGSNPVSDVLKEIPAEPAFNELSCLNRLEDYWRNFLERRGCLEFSISYPYSNGLQFSYETVMLFTQAIPQAKRVSLPEFKNCFELPGGLRICLETDSTYGPLRAEAIEQFGENLEDSNFSTELTPRGVMVVNPQNKVQVARRNFDVSEHVQAIIQKHEICLLTSQELLQFHNQIQLTNHGQEELMDKILGSHRGAPSRW